MYRIALSAISMALAGIFVASPARAADSARRRRRMPRSISRQWKRASTI